MIFYNQPIKPFLQYILETRSMSLNYNIIEKIFDVSQAYNALFIKIFLFFWKILEDLVIVKNNVI